MSGGVVALKVAGGAHSEEEDADGCDSAGDDYEECIADTAYIADFLLLFHFCCGVGSRLRILRFHNV